LKRRGFVGAAGSFALAAMWPTFLREAFADGEACDATRAARLSGPAHRVAIVAAAFRRAHRAGQPLLVLVIPASDDTKYERGQAFGELLNHGSDADLAPLADVEVVCATTEELRKLVPSASPGDPLMVLVRPSATPVTATKLDAPLPNAPIAEGGVDWEERMRRIDELPDRRIALLASLLHRELGSARGDVHARAAEVRARLCRKPPEGTHWAVASGCGSSIEGIPQTQHMACGMGHVPEKSRRFLYFFAIPKG
jgi:hypothetical protein